MAEGVDLGQVGAFSTPPLPRVFLMDYNNHLIARFIRSCKFAVAQALIDCLAFCQEGLELRGLLPYYDFDWSHTATDEELATLEDLDQKYRNARTERAAEENSKAYWKLYNELDRRKPRYWSQGPFEENNAVDVLAYRTSLRGSNTDHKVMMIFGVMHQLAEPVSPVAELKIIKGNGTKVIDDIDLGPIGSYSYKVGDEIKFSEDRSDCFIFERPILFSKNDDMTIRLTTSDVAKGKTSRVMLIGMVAEPLGTTVIG